MVTNTPATTTSLLGDSYRVEVAASFEDSFSSHRPAYYLHGKRSAVYALYRNARSPEFLFPVNARTGAVVTLKGNAWVKEEGAALRVIS